VIYFRLDQACGRKTSYERDRMREGEGKRKREIARCKRFRVETMLAMGHGTNEHERT